MRKATPIFLPVLAGLLAIFLLNCIYDICTKTGVASSVPGETRNELLLYGIIAPLFFVIMVLIQAVAMLPVWAGKKASAKRIISVVLIFSLLPGIGIGYLSWSDESGYIDLMKLVSAISFIMLCYWMANVLTLRALEKRGKIEIAER